MARLNSRFLVFTSAGDHANIARWLPNRNFDLWISYYGHQPDPDRMNAEFYDHKKGAKFPKLYEAMRQDPERFSAYDYIWVADDDIKISGAQINRLFEIAKAKDLWIAQPAFTDAGKISNKITRKQQFAHLRYTNFVEVTCPVFRTDKLLQFFEVYDPKLIGFGVDWWFMEALRPPADKVAVVDSIPCVNPRDQEKGSAREIDQLQSYDQRRQVWERLKQERNLTLDQTKRKNYRITYTPRSIATGILRPDWFFQKLSAKAIKWIKKKRNKTTT